MTICDAIRHLAAVVGSNGGGRVLEVELNVSAFAQLETEIFRQHLNAGGRLEVPQLKPTARGRAIVFCDIPVTVYER